MGRRVTYPWFDTLSGGKGATGRTVDVVAATPGRMLAIGEVRSAEAITADVF